MILLHVSSITNNQASGMSVVVPLHAQYQNLIVDVALLNCSNIIPDIADMNFPVFTRQKDIIDGDITNLPSPYNKPDLVVFHGIYIPFYLKIVKSVLKNKIPYIVVPHGSLSGTAQESKRLKKMIGNMLFFNRIIKNALAVQYLSVEEKKASIAKNNHGFVGCNGMSTSSTGTRTVVNRENLKMIFIGRLDPFHKGIDVLLEACNLIKNEMREKKISLSIYGPDHEGGRALISKMINDFNINDIVSLNQGLFGEEKVNQLIQSDVFIQTSRFEGQPLGVMEAMAYGVPVIVTPGTNMADEVKDNNCGWKTELYAEDIAKTILDVNSNKERLSDFSQNAADYVNETFDWKKVSTDTIEIYKKLININ